MNKLTQTEATPTALRVSTGSLCGALMRINACALLVCSGIAIEKGESLWACGVAMLLACYFLARGNEMSRENAAYQPAGGEASTETKSNEQKP
jgi:hypothetical protein